ncbi:MAG TPA: carboxyl transferase domain-containing protein [Mycobacteriales bacterium]|nr:carboxyl transferase domain-containing protein [Mycobacteriales bacterium]
MTSDRLSARELLAITVDDGSFTGWDEPVDHSGADPAYRAELAAAARSSGVDEAVLTGEARIGGHPIALVVSEFGFLGGSIGVATADRLVAAIERATERGLPLLAGPASGGTRMQEGTLAFVQMIRVSAAVTAHKRAGLSYLVYLRHPTTGGVLASWASLGQLTVAEPGALIGFLGPRVYEALYGTVFPPEVQTAEHLAERGLIDAVVAPADLAVLLARTLDVLCAPRVAEGEALPAADPALPAGDAWDSITRSRRPDRPGIRRLLDSAATNVVALSGTGEGELDPALVLGLARFGPVPCVFLGQDRGEETLARPLGPGALRVARRGMRLATELRLPLVTVIDTAGAALSVEAEEGGLAGEIARCLEDLATLDAPVVSVLLGQGTGGAALALLPADRVVAAQHAWLAPLPPEGASAIRYRDLDHAADMARSQGVGVADLYAAGIVDRIVAESPDAADEPDRFCRRLGAVLAAELGALSGRTDPDRLRRRAAKFSGRAPRTP